VVIQAHSNGTCVKVFETSSRVFKELGAKPRGNTQAVLVAAAFSGEPRDYYLGVVHAEVNRAYQNFFYKMQVGGGQGAAAWVTEGAWGMQHGWACWWAPTAGAAYKAGFTFLPPSLPPCWFNPCISVQEQLGVDARLTASCPVPLPPTLLSATLCPAGTPPLPDIRRQPADAHHQLGSPA
jgi:hypothetical protein